MIAGPDELVRLTIDFITRCWHQKPERRPTFTGAWYHAVRSYFHRLLIQALPVQQLTTITLYQLNYSYIQVNQLQLPNTLVVPRTRTKFADRSFAACGTLCRLRYDRSPATDSLGDI